MRASFWANARLMGSLCRLKVRAQRSRLAKIDVLRFVAVARVVVDQHSDHTGKRTRDLDFLGAEKGHLVEPEVARRDSRELGVQVGGGGEDAAHHLLGG